MARYLSDGPRNFDRNFNYVLPVKTGTVMAMVFVHIYVMMLLFVPKMTFHQNKTSFSGLLHLTKTKPIIVGTCHRPPKLNNFLEEFEKNPV